MELEKVQVAPMLSPRDEGLDGGERPWASWKAADQIGIGENGVEELEALG